MFFRSLGGLIDGFKERTKGVKELLADPATTFLVVTSPEREPVEEAIYFRGKLREAKLPFGGLIVNRVQPFGTEPADEEALARELRRRQARGEGRRDVGRGARARRPRSGVDRAPEGEDRRLRSGARAAARRRRP